MSDSFPILSVCLLWPLLGAAGLLLLPGSRIARSAALAVAVLELILTLIAAAIFDPTLGDFQLVEDLTWIPSLNIHYQLGVDAISLWFLPLSAFLSVSAIAAGWNSIQRLQNFHLALLLALQSITVGVLTALDLALFFLFWELTLPPLFFLIGLWGIGAERRAAAMKYVLYMLFGGVPLLFGIVLLALEHAQLHGSLSFSLPALLNSQIPEAAQQTIFLLMLLGFAVKAPLLPLHTWLPTTASEAPPQITAMLVGLKLGVYGIIRFVLPLTPAAAWQHRWLLAIFGTLALVYGALLALRQTNLRRLLAYAGVSHVGLVVVAIAAFNQQAIQGALMQLLNFAIVAAGAMLIAGMIQQRLGSNELSQMAGLAKTMPRAATLLFLFALSSIGVPGLNGFPAELLMLLGILQAYPALAVIALLAAVLAAAYMLGFIRQAFFGPVSSRAVAQLTDLNRRELLLLAPAALLVLALGLFPQVLLDAQQATTSVWLQRLQPAKVQLTDVAAFEQTGSAGENGI